MNNKSPFNFWSWALWCGIGEFSGIVVAVAIFWFMGKLGEPQTALMKGVQILIMAVAGILEGAATGYFQWSILKKKFAVKAENWLIPTALGGATGWLLGLIPSVFILPEEAARQAAASNIELTPYHIIILALISGWIVGAVFGVFQWLELRKYAAEASRWIWSNATGWALGFILIYFAASAPTKETPFGVTVTLTVGAVLLAGLLVGAMTGLFLITSKPAPVRNETGGV